jgi:hypothetical protein
VAHCRPGSLTGPLICVDDRLMVTLVGQDTASERAPRRRMLPSVIGGPA